MDTGYSSSLFDRTVARRRPVWVTVLLVFIVYLPTLAAAASMGLTDLLINPRGRSVLTAPTAIDHPTGQLNNLVSLSRVPPTMGDQVPVPFPTKKCVSKAVRIGTSANGRGLARHWKYADAKQETEFGKALDIWLGAQGPLAREYPHTVFAVFPHRVGKREPSVTRQTDLALEVYIGNQTTPGFNTLHTMPIRAGYASGIPYFPDWVNFSNQSGLPDLDQPATRLSR